MSEFVGSKPFEPFKTLTLSSPHRARETTRRGLERLKLFELTELRSSFRPIARNRTGLLLG